MKQNLVLMLMMCLLSFGLAGCDKDKESAPASPEAAAPASPEVTAPAAKDAEPAVEKETAQSPAVASERSEKTQETVQTPSPEQPAEAAPSANSGQESSEQAQDASMTVSQEALLHHRFVLDTVDGEAFSVGERQPEIEFLEGFRVAGGICNRFSGTATLENGTLTVAQMATTRMLCADEALNSLETRFANLLQKGAELAVTENTLTMSGAELTLGWKLEDRVQ